MTRLIGTLLLILGVSAVAFANPGPPPAPEIDPGMAGSSMAMIAGAWLVIRSHRRK